MLFTLLTVCVLQEVNPVKNVCDLTVKKELENEKEVDQITEDLRVLTAV